MGKSITGTVFRGWFTSLTKGRNYARNWQLGQCKTWK